HQNVRELPISATKLKLGAGHRHSSCSLSQGQLFRLERPALAIHLKLRFFRLVAAVTPGEIVPTISAQKLAEGCVPGHNPALGIVSNEHSKRKDLHDGFQFGNTLFQLAIEILNLFFRSHVTADVGRGAKPTNNSPMRVTNRNRPREEPAVTT